MKLINTNPICMMIGGNHLIVSMPPCRVRWLLNSPNCVGSILLMHGITTVIAHDYHANWLSSTSSTGSRNLISCCIYCVERIEITCNNCKCLFVQTLKFHHKRSCLSKSLFILSIYEGCDDTAPTAGVWLSNWFRLADMRISFHSPADIYEDDCSSITFCQ